MCTIARNVTLRVLISVVLLAVASVPLSAQNVPESCGVRDWFRLRDKVAQGDSFLLSKGAMDAAFEYRREAVVGSRESTPSDQSISLAFDGQWTRVQTVVHERLITLQFDTGAPKTYLYQTLADAYPSLMQLGQHRQEKITEMSGTSYQEAIEVPTVGFRLTPRVEMDLAPATVILNATGEYIWDGNFGFDLLDKALPVTIDFRAMRLSFP